MKGDTIDWIRSSLFDGRTVTRCQTRTKAARTAAADVAAATPGTCPAPAVAVYSGEDASGRMYAVRLLGRRAPGSAAPVALAARLTAKCGYELHVFNFDQDGRWAAVFTKEAFE